jgi:uncharacterized protein DUF1707
MKVYRHAVCLCLLPAVANRLATTVITTGRSPTIIAVAPTRAKDSDRDDTCKILDAALDDGQLSMEEHRERVTAATSAVTLADLHALIADLQTSSSPVQLQPLSSRPKFGSRGIAAAALLVAVLLGLGIGWGLYGHSSSPLSVVSDSGSKPGAGAPAIVPKAPMKLLTVRGLTGLLDQTRKKFGDTMGLRLVIYPDYAVLDRPDPNEQRRELSYTYHGGWGELTTSSRNSRDAVVDLGRFDAAKAAGIVTGAPQALGIKPSDVKSTYLIVQPADDQSTPGAVSLSAYVSADYGSGYIQFAGDGTVERVTPPS